MTYKLRFHDLAWSEWQRLDGSIKAPQRCGLSPNASEANQQPALPNQLSGASRTFVVADPEQRVFGYYAMAAGAVSHQAATSAVRRNMPEPVPVMVLARLAVDHRAQGLKPGGALLQDAVNRAVTVSQNAGVRALLVHALHDHAKQFYEYYGFHTGIIAPPLSSTPAAPRRCPPQKAPFFQARHPHARTR